ncbi:cation diffusion facilitator family transporter [Eubacteriales bacterium OttesenSCG-928-N13]|nr:cation diffusion facilitator family transporter [Eubacteriales bacterium OttesenSCG-928-N13]
MLSFLIRKFVREPDNATDVATRSQYSQLAGGMGMVLNFLLFLVKLPIGIITGSIAVSSDAFNNISDMGSSLITLVAARMAGRKPDREHPFGHGRIEYVCALGIAALILVVGIELLKESILKLASPTAVQITPLIMVLLGASILVKLWMYYYNRQIGARIQSGVLRAAATDSLNDVFTTTLVLAAALIDPYVRIPVDAVAGLIISVLVLVSGIRIAKDTVDLLLGSKPDPELVKKIRELVLETDGIVGIHDMILHDYGPGRVMASVHAEVSDSEDINLSHEQIDAAEKRILEQLNIPIVIHMDPISLNDARTNAVRDSLIEQLKDLDPSLSMHDFRMVEGEHQINLIFDLVVPHEMDSGTRDRLKEQLLERMQQLDSRYQCVIQIDENFAE